MIRIDGNSLAKMEDAHHLINKTRISDRTARRDASTGCRQQLLPGVIGHMGVRSAGESNNRENFRSSGIIEEAKYDS